MIWLRRKWLKKSKMAAKGICPSCDYQPSTLHEGCDCRSIVRRLFSNYRASTCCTHPIFCPFLLWTLLSSITEDQRVYFCLGFSTVVTHFQSKLKKQDGGHHPLIQPMRIANSGQNGGSKEKIRTSSMKDLTTSLLRACDQRDDHVKVSLADIQGHVFGFGSSCII